VLKAGFRKCHRRPQHRLPLGCELRAWQTHPHLPRITRKCWVHDPASCSDAIHTRACTGIKKRS